MPLSPSRRLVLALLLVFIVPAISLAQAPASQDGLAVVVDPVTLERFGTIATGEIVEVYVVLTDLVFEVGGMTAVQFGLDLDPRLTVFDRRFAPESTLNLEVGPDELIVGFGDCIDFRDTPFVVMSMKVLFTGVGSADDLVIDVRDLDAYGEPLRLTRCDAAQEVVPVVDMGGIVLNPVNERVAYFGAAPRTAVQFRDLDLGWATFVPAGLERDAGANVGTTGQQTFSALGTETYVLRADGTGEVLAEFSPDVIQQPRVDSFTSEIVPGAVPAQVRLGWAVSGADEVEVAGVGGYPSIGGVVVDVVDPTITLRATNEFGTTAEVTVVETGDGRPAILSFTAAPTFFAPGEDVTLSWRGFDADLASIEPEIGAVDPEEGAVVVSPTAETTYTLTLTNDVGSVTADLTLAPSVPVISLFNVTPAAVLQGQAVEVSWFVQAADQVVLDPGGLVLDPQEGIVEILPDTTVTEYTLTATNALGQVTATRPVDVTTPRIFFFRFAEAGAFPGDPVRLEWSVTPGATMVIEPEVGVVAPPFGYVNVFPTVEGQTYTMTVTAGTTVLTAETEPIALLRPEVRLQAPAIPVDIGHPFNLRIECAGCDSLRVDPYPGTPIPVAPEGQQFFPIVIPGSTPLVATAYNTAGASTDSIFVQAQAVRDPVATLDAPADVFPNQPFVLQAFVDYARSATLDPGAVAVPSGESTFFDLSIAETTEYTLFAESPAGTTQVTREVRVVAPVISQFLAPDEVFPGEEFTLEFDVQGATSIDLDPYAGTIALGQTSVTTSIAEETIFTLTATNPAGSTVLTRTVRTPTPRILDFSTAADAIVPGESATLNWTVTGADLIELYDADDELVATGLAASGTLVVSPTETTDFTLRATNVIGTSEAAAVVLVVPIRIDSFTASSNFVEAGTVALLSWEVVGAGTVELEGFGDKPLVAQFNVLVTETTTYRLIARGAGGFTQTAEVTIRVAGDGANVVRWSWTPTGDDSSPPPLPAFVPFTVWVVIDDLVDDLAGFSFGVDYPDGVFVLSRTFTDPLWINVAGGSDDFIVGGPNCITPSEPFAALAFQFLSVRELDPTQDFLEIREVEDGSGGIVSPIEIRLCDGEYAPAAAGPPLPLGETDIVSAVTVDLRAEAGDAGTKLSWSWGGGCADEVLVLRRRGNAVPELVATLTGEDACGAWTAPASADDVTWRVVVVTPTGSLHSTEVRAEAPRSTLPSRNALLENVPNPFNPATDLRFTLREAGPVTLEIFDTAGRRVRRLDLGERPVGEGAVTWRGRDQAGRVVSSGVYLVRMVTRDGVDTRRVLLLK